MSVDDTIRTSLEQLVRPVEDPDVIVAQVNHRRAQHRRRRNTGRALAAAALLVALGVTAAAVGPPGSEHDEVTAGVPDSLPSTSLTVPPAGAVVADQLGDGTPVWVVRHDNETVSVLDALSTHQPFGVGHLVGWCATSNGFEDPQWGSTFDAQGEKRAGPAPSGLRAYEVGPIADGQVLVSPPASPRGDDGESTAPAAEGPPCYGDDPQYNAGTLQLHDVGDTRSVTLEGAMTAPVGDLVLVRGSTILLTPEGATVCPSDDGLRPTRPRCDGVAAPELALGEGRMWATLTGTFLARVGEDVLLDVAFVSGLALHDDDGVAGLGDVEPQAAGLCRPHLDDYGVDADLLVARTVGGEYEVECWVHGQVAKSPPEGAPFDLAVIGVRADGTAELIRAGYIDSTVLPSGAPADDAHGGGPTFEVLAVIDATEPMGTLRSAVDQEELVELWSATDGVGPAPVVDLEQWVVVSMTIPDDDCPPELTRFESEWMVFTPVFTEPLGACRLPLIPKTFVAALDRATLAPSFVLRLPGDEVYGYDEQQLRVEVRSP